MQIMRRNRFFQSLQVIAAFEHGDNAPAGGLVGKVHQLTRDPGVVLGAQIQRRQRIAVMRIEAGGDDQQLGAEFFQPRQDQALERGTEFGPAVLGRERCIDDGVVIAALALGAGARKQRHLVRRAVHHGRVRPEDVLRAVAVMHVEIDDGGALDAVFALRMNSKRLCPRVLFEGIWKFVCPVIWKFCAAFVSSFAEARDAVLIASALPTRFFASCAHFVCGLARCADCQLHPCGLRFSYRLKARLAPPNDITSASRGICKSTTLGRTALEAKSELKPTNDFEPIATALTS